MTGSGGSSFIFWISNLILVDVSTVDTYLPLAWVSLSLMLSTYEGFPLVKKPAKWHYACGSDRNRRYPASPAVHGQAKNIDDRLSQIIETAAEAKKSGISQTQDTGSQDRVRLDYLRDFINTGIIVIDGRQKLLGDDGQRRKFLYFLDF